MHLKTIQAAVIRKGTRVLVRADFDVKVRRGQVVDDFRIRAALPTIRFLLARGARVRILAHRDRPHGRRVPSLSLTAVGRVLERLLGRKVVMVPDPFSEHTRARLNESGGVLLFENLRFWPGEEKNSASFARALARWGDIYVNEAFATSHRRHASIARLPALLPAFAGQYLEREVDYLTKVRQKPRRPFVAILGGAKLETKLPFVQLFLKTSDAVLVGGKSGNLLCAPDAHKRQGKYCRSPLLWLPVDGRAARIPRGRGRIAAVDGLRSGETFLDIGPQTIRMFEGVLRGAKTVVWNGPMGYTERPAFAKGTKAIARAVARVRGLTVIGGVDTVSALRSYYLLKGFSHVSVGGGAMLEFLLRGTLPGIEALKRKA